jgi:autotransporter translocation and assembly factor TamB
LKTGPVSRFLKSADARILGPTNHYTIKASFVSKYTRLKATGNGNNHSANLTLFSDSNDNTFIAGKISLDWRNEFSWNGKLDLKNISTKSFFPDGPMIYSLTTTSTGNAGKQLNAIDWSIDAKTGAGDIHSKGKYNGKSLDFKWQIKNLNPTPFYPDINGLVNTNGAFNNTKTKGSFSIKNGMWEGLTLNDLALKWQGDIAQKAIDFLDLEINNFSSDTIRIRKGNIHFQKTSNKTTPFSMGFKIDSEGTPFQSLDIRGSIRQELNEYALSLNQFNLNALLTRWSLRHPVSFLLFTDPTNANRVSTWKQTPFCLDSKSAYLCANSFMAKGDWSATLKAKNIPIQNINKVTNLVLPTNIDAHFYQKQGEPLLGQADIEIPQAEVTFAEYAVEYPVRLKNTKFLLKLLPTSINMTSTSHWGKSDYWQLDGSITRPDDSANSWEKSQLTSSLKVSVNNLDFMNTFSDIFDIHSGSVAVDLKMSGLADAPNVQGKIELKKINFELVPVTNVIRDITGTIEFNHLTAFMKITGQTKTAPIHLSGKASVGRDFKNMEADFSVQGKNLTLADSSNYQAVANVSLDGKLTNNLLSIKGSVNVPTATISPTSIASSATTLPRDVVILGEKKSQGMGSNLDVLITLGEKVIVKTKQVYARLTGALQISQKSDSGLIGKGAIAIKDGKVSDFDLNLDVSDDSTISYDNTLLTSPFINVKIFRRIKQGGFGTSSLATNTDLIVGISAIGVYQNLVVTLYSSPVQLGQSDILSYLILGHPVGNADGFNLASLLATVGSVSSDSLSNALGKLLSIKNALGFTELGVQSNLSLDALGTPYGVDESGFVVGRYLTSKVYVRYISGISTNLNLFQLQYLFNPNWSVQVQSGNVDSTNVQGVDALYHFTRWSRSKGKQQ